MLPSGSLARTARYHITSYCGFPKKSTFISYDILSTFEVLLNGTLYIHLALHRRCPFIQNRKIPLVHEQPVAAFSCDLSRNPVFDEQFHRPGRGWEGPRRSLANFGQRQDRTRLERFMHANSRTGALTGRFDATVVFLEHLAELLGSIDGACGRHAYAFEEKGVPFHPIIAVAHVVKREVYIMQI